MPNNVIELIVRTIDQASGPNAQILQSVKRLTAGFVAAFSFKKIIDNTVEAQAAVAQLGVAFAQSAESARRSQQEILEFSAAAQRATAFSDEAVTRAQTTLLRFGRVSGETFERTRKTILDVAAALHIDLETAASSVGRAMESPIQGMRQLRSLGVVFTESQRELIKTLEETGQSAKANALFLETLESRFGGAAAAARDTLGGALTGLKNAFGDLLEGSEKDTRGVVEGINSITAALQSDELRGALADVTKLIGGMISLLVQVGATAVTAFKIMTTSAISAAEELDKTLTARLGETWADIKRGSGVGTRAALAGAPFLGPLAPGIQGGLLPGIVSGLAPERQRPVAGTSAARGGGSGLTFVPQTELDRQAADALAAYNKELEELLKNINTFDAGSLIHPLPVIDEQTFMKTTEQFEQFQRDLVAATDKIPTVVEEALKRTEAPIDNFVDSFKRAFGDVINTGELSFKSFVRSFIAELSKQAIFNAIDKIGKALKDALSPSGSGGGGGSGFASTALAFIGSLFGAAGGGLITKPTLVGEEGPELAVPMGSAQIFNRRQLAAMGGGGGRFSFNTTINISGGGGDRREREQLAAAFRIEMERNNARQQDEFARILERNDFGRVR